MLVLNRKSMQRIIIGDNVTVTILGIQGQQVRVGIEAPQSVAIRREELIWQDAGLSKKEMAGVLVH